MTETISCSWLSHFRPLAVRSMVEPRPSFDHIPVLERAVLEALTGMPSGVFVDATIGGAGHAFRLLETFPGLVIHGFDRDPTALAAAAARIVDFGDQVVLHAARFDRAVDLLADAGITAIVGFLMDLGVSSPQLDRADRGFSYRNSGPLDMRMDPSQGITAAEVVNEYTVGELIDVLSSYGDERHARRIANAIVVARPIFTTVELAEVVANAVPAAARRQPGHPAKRSFQALRIEVNDELAVLGPTLDGLIGLLEPNGIGLVLTYHSGEDRIVKDRMRQAIGEDVPNVPSSGDLRWLFRGSRTATADELESNRRARSARLRGIVRRGGST